MFSMESDYSELLRRPNWLILPSPEAQPAPRVHSSTSRFQIAQASSPTGSMQPTVSKLPDWHSDFLAIIS